MRPMIDIKEILEKSINDHKLIVTLPWVVQYVSMLDPVSLRTDYYRDVFKILYKLYLMTSELENNTIMLSMRKTSVSIIRFCLGWLFEQSNVPNEYYSYRLNRKHFEKMMHANPTMTSIAVSKELSVNLSEEYRIAIRSNNTNTNELTRTIEHFNNGQNALTNNVRLKTTHKQETELKNANIPKFDPLLEAVLQAACPFLVDFRVSIMPQRSAKTISRTVRPHILKICDSSTNTKTTQTMQSNENNAQTKLIEVFLRSQDVPVKQCVEFAQERTYSYVIDHFQMKTLTPFKQSISESIDKIQSKELDAIRNELYSIYTNGEKELLEKWKKTVNEETLRRVKHLLEGSLPLKTADSCKLVCINIAVQQALTRINTWRSRNLNGIEIFSKDIQADAEKILNRTSMKLTQMKTTFTIDITKRPPWQTADDLQYKLHQLSMFPQKIHGENINQICMDIEKCISEHVLPDPMCKTIGVMMINLLLLLICNRNDLVTDHTIDRFIKLWKYKQFELFVHFTEEQTKSPKFIDTNYLFSVVLSPVWVFMQHSKHGNKFEKLTHLLIKLIKNDLMNIRFLNEQYMKLLQSKLNQTTLETIAGIIKKVIDNCTIAM